MNQSRAANGATRRAIAIAVVTGDDDRHGFIDRLAGLLEVERVTSSPVALTRAIAKARASAAMTPGALVIAVVPSSKPELVMLAAIDKCDRIAVVHDAHAPISELAARAVRAAFALVDLTLAIDLESERSAIRAGADPNRIVRDPSAASDRLLHEPQRRRRTKAAIEMTASLFLDAAEASGIIRFLEVLSPDRGVNVVNYHRILPVAEINEYCRQQMAMAEPIFEAQLDLISRRRGFTSIDAIREPESKDKVAITFDDGYEDNFRVALPILQRFSAPACIFVVTNLIGRPDALWWDRLGFALFAYWRHGRDCPLPHVLPKRAEALRTARSIESVRSIVSDLISELNRLTAPERNVIVEAAESVLPSLDIGTRTMLSWEEVEAMARLGINFGAHTRNHVPLSEVPHDVAREELIGSQSDLDGHLSHSQPRVLALPRGELGTLTEDEIRLAGFRAVMTSDPGVNRTDGPSFFVRRRDGKMLTLAGRHHPAKLRLELTGLMDRLRQRLNRSVEGPAPGDHQDDA